MKRAAFVNNTGDPNRLIEKAVALEASGGWHGFFVMDHLQLAVDSPLAVVDPWVLLGAIAARTETLMLGAMVTPISRRRPWQLAKEIITLDTISQGRVIVGVGLGGFDEAEFHAFGDTASRSERAARTDEALELLDLFLRGEPVSHEGEHYQVQAHLKPTAFQQPRPKIWIAATPPYRKPLARAKRWDGVFCNLKLEANEAGETAFRNIPTPHSPEEVHAYLGDLIGVEGFDVVAMRHPDIEPRAYCDAGVTWLLDVHKL